MIDVTYRRATRYEDGRVTVSARVYFDRADIEAKVARINEGERRYGKTVHFVKVFRVETTTEASQ